MNHIITGQFQSRDKALAVAASIAHYIAVGDIALDDKPRQFAHNARPAADNDGQAADSDGTGAKALRTATVAGLAAGAVGAIGGPVVALAAAGTAAYVGSLVGALHSLKDHPHEQTSPGNPAEATPAATGVSMSVRVENELNEERVIDSMRRAGAEAVETKDGPWPLAEPLTTLPQVEG